MSSVFGGVITEGLKKLLQALQALQPAPNAETVEIDDTILLKKSGVPDITNTLDSTSITLENQLGGTAHMEANVFQITSGDALFTTIIGEGGVGIGDSSLGPLRQNGLNIDGMNVEPGTYQTHFYHDRLELIDSTIDFTFQNDNRFMKWDCGTSFRVNVDDHHVRVDDSFKCSRNGMSFDFEVYTNYLDDQGNAGWSVQLSNQDGGDINVNNPDIKFYYHPSGYVTGTMLLKKYATARFTLVPAPNESPPFAWAVSMY